VNNCWISLHELSVILQIASRLPTAAHQFALVTGMSSRKVETYCKRVDMDCSESPKLQLHGQCRLASTSYTFWINLASGWKTWHFGDKKQWIFTKYHWKFCLKGCKWEPKRMHNVEWIFQIQIHLQWCCWESFLFTNLKIPCFAAKFISSGL